jgi:hypothetical protein
LNALSQPIVWFPTLGVLIATLAFLGSRQSRGITRGTLIVLALIFVFLPSFMIANVLAPNLFDSRIRAYWAFYDSIEVGMTREQVLNALDNCYPDVGNRQRPRIVTESDDRLGFFMNPEQDREPNCEGIFLDLSEGVVTRKSYSRD